MKYGKYIFDWENELLSLEEYSETDKYAFALLKEARHSLSNYIAKNDLADDQELISIQKQLIKIQQELSHIELEFDTD